MRWSQKLVKQFDELQHTEQKNCAPQRLTVIEIFNLKESFHLQLNAKHESISCLVLAMG
jgi:hypothetical protein